MFIKFRGTSLYTNVLIKFKNTHLQTNVFVEFRSHTFLDQSVCRVQKTYFQTNYLKILTGSVMHNY